jgi:hypothetical protein
LRSDFGGGDGGYDEDNYDASDLWLKEPACFDAYIRQI